MEVKKGLAAVGVVAACAACCAPLLLPMLSGFGLTAGAAAGAGALFGLPADTIICGGLAVGVLAAIGMWAWRQRRKQAAAAACARVSSGADGSTLKPEDVARVDSPGCSPSCGCGS